MKVTEIPTADLERILADTERAVGPDSQSTKLFREELERRRDICMQSANATGKDESGSTDG